MELFNKSTRTFYVFNGEKEEDGRLKVVPFSKETSLDLPDEEAAKLLELYAGEIISLADVKPSFSDELDAEKAAHTETKSMLDKAITKLKELGMDIEGDESTNDGSIYANFKQADFDAELNNRNIDFKALGVKSNKGKEELLLKNDAEKAAQQ